MALKITHLGTPLKNSTFAPSSDLINAAISKKKIADFMISLRDLRVHELTADWSRLDISIKKERLNVCICSRSET